MTTLVVVALSVWGCAPEPPVNFGTFVGQGSIRERVVGDQDRPATVQEIEAMRGEVDAAARRARMDDPDERARLRISSRSMRTRSWIAQRLRILIATP